MSMTGLGVFDTTVQKSNLWLKSIMEELDWNDKHKAYLALRIVLHTLRDRLTFEAVVEFGAQLPMLIRGLYYEGWEPEGKPIKYKHKEDFLAPVVSHFQDDPLLDAERVARTVFDVIAKNVSEGEVKTIKNLLPKDLSSLWPKAA
ncbi:MAG: DUF2267 domain-containing protein [Candidatus Margulisiibacteriota bacterium]|nr:MAG: hypothetical protein A2X43_05425 [Candidatus Margulisbacteria bacterium GWD2_39_127]OGI04353.1 MAG: hypothetical protein A2X42_07105 [Candidatus Margulisbacteria bacterium GWF2_38_17]OGI07791.1 MAG: hypothetical protein A2X41_07865 [Candidatus Margulisbacteria bacterium GWE2_39_32]PZM84840.1 MAG: DUF2267 domain-containing protein [Candidatus Margulisiibacteriota bacterium]HAR63287.1 DUF2267 domain-containing protein [Candidatus Margulisiibacteriota bacterium]